MRITTVTRLEVGYSARTAADMRAGFREPPGSAMPVEYLTAVIEDASDPGRPRRPSAARESRRLPRRQRIGVRSGGRRGQG